MLGHPKFKIDDQVRFKLADGTERRGSVYIVDKFGTFEQKIDVSYDMLVESENCLYKHVMEKYVYAYVVKVTGGSVHSYYIGNNGTKATNLNKAKKFTDIDEAETEASKWLLQMMKAHWDSAKTEVVEINNE